MSDNVVRIADYERRSREPDGAQPRDPADADVIILPVIRRFNDQSAAAIGPLVKMMPVAMPREVEP